MGTSNEKADKDKEIKKEEIIEKCYIFPRGF